MGTPTPVPILAAVGRPEDVSEGLSLGPELGGAELVFEEELAAGAEATDFVAVRLSVELDLPAVIELEVVVIEIAEDDVKFILLTSKEVVVGPIPKTSSAPSGYTVPGAGLVDEEIVILAVAAGTLEGESVPHGLQPPDP